MVENHGPVVTSSTQSGTTHLPFINHTFETGTEGWKANSFFGAYLDPISITRSTTRFKTGTASLEVTFPALSGNAISRVVPDSAPGFVIGSYYSMEADVWVEAGGPDVRIDPFLQADQTGPAQCLEKDQWVHISTTFRSVSESGEIWVGINTTSTAPAGKKVWIDNVIIKPAPLTPGDYMLSVSTFNSAGTSPWSAEVPFKVKSPPRASGINLNPQRVGSNINVGWIYSDQDSDALTKHQVRYRRK